MINKRKAYQIKEISKLKMLISNAIPVDTDIALIIISLNDISSDFARILIEEDENTESLGLSMFDEPYGGTND